MRTAPMLVKSVALAAMLCATQAFADTAFQLGDTTGSPTFNRPLADLSGLSGVGTEVAYDSFSFSVDLAGTYSFFSLTLPLVDYPAWDNFIILYAGASFDPNSALTNALIANDDANDDANNIGRSRFDYDLSTGVAYTLVTTGFGNDDYGRYLNVIRGPGVIAAPVPEPETYALLLAGLAVVGFVAGRRRQS